MSSKKIIAMGLLAAFTAGVTFAAAPASTKESAPVEKHAKGPAQAMKRFTGVVDSVDAAAGTLAVKETKGKVMVFATDRATMLRRTGRNIKVADVAVGDRIMVRFVEIDGKAVIKMAMVVGPRKPVKPAENKQDKK